MHQARNAAVHMHGLTTFPQATLLYPTRHCTWSCGAGTQPHWSWPNTQLAERPDPHPHGLGAHPHPHGLGAKPCPHGAWGESGHWAGRQPAPYRAGGKTSSAHRAGRQGAKAHPTTGGTSECPRDGHGLGRGGDRRRGLARGRGLTLGAQQELSGQPRWRQSRGFHLPKPRAPLQGAGVQGVKWGAKIQRWEVVAVHSVHTEQDREQQRKQRSKPMSNINKIKTGPHRSWTLCVSRSIYILSIC